MKRILALLIVLGCFGCAPKYPKLGRIIGNPKDFKISKPVDESEDLKYRGRKHWR